MALRTKAMAQRCERAGGHILFDLSEVEPKDASPSGAWLSNRDSAAAAAGLVGQITLLERAEKADMKAEEAAARAARREAKEHKDGMRRAADAAKTARADAWKHKMECHQQLERCEKLCAEALLLGHGLTEAKADVPDAHADLQAANDAFEPAKHAHKVAESALLADKKAETGTLPFAPKVEPKAEPEVEPEAAAASAPGSADEPESDDGPRPPSMRKHVSRRKILAEAAEAEAEAAAAAAVEPTEAELKEQARVALRLRKQRLEQQLRAQAPIRGREEPGGFKNLYWILPADAEWSVAAPITDAPSWAADSRAKRWVPDGAAMVLVERVQPEAAAVEEAARERHVQAHRAPHRQGRDAVVHLLDSHQRDGFDGEGVELRGRAAAACDG